MSEDDPQGDPIAAALAKAKAAQGPSTPPAATTDSGDPIADALAQARLGKFHQDAASGALQRRTAVLNRNDQGAAGEGNPSYMDRLGSMAERAASVLPGGSAAMTATRSGITGEPWNTAAKNVASDAEEAAQNAPGVGIPKGVPFVGGSRLTLADLPAAMAGGSALMKAVPALGIPAQSAVYGGSLRATNPESESVPSRIGHSTLAALLSGAVGKAAEMGGTTASALTAPAPKVAVDAMKTARGDAANVTYPAAIAEGKAAMASSDAAKQGFMDRLQAMLNPPKALPAPGQSEVAKAAMREGDALRTAHPAVRDDAAGAPSVDAALAQDYTRATPPGEPLPDQPIVRDFTSPRPVQLRAANDVNVRANAPAPPQPTAKVGAFPAASSVYPTPDLVKALQEPDIADIVSGLQQTRQFREMPAHDPELLDAVFKVFSDREGKLEATQANNPKNLGRFELQNIGDAKHQLVNAMSGDPAYLNGPMPSYRQAVSDFAGDSRQIEGYGKGYEAARAKMGSRQPSFKTIDKATTNEQTAPLQPDQQDAAQAGARGFTGAELKAHPASLIKPWAPGWRAVWNAPGVSRDLGAMGGGTPSTLSDLLRSATVSTSGRAP